MVDQLKHDIHLDVHAIKIYVPITNAWAHRYRYRLAGGSGRVGGRTKYRHTKVSAAIL